MGTKVGTPTILEIREKATRIAYGLAYEEIVKEFGEELARNDPERFYQELDRRVEHYQALLLAKEIQKLPVRTTGRGRPSKMAKEVREFLKEYQKAVEDADKETEPVYYVYSHIEVKVDGLDDKLIYWTFVGKFKDYNTAYAEAQKHKGFIIEDKLGKGFSVVLSAVRRDITENRQEIIGKVQKRLLKALKRKSVIRYVFRVHKAKDEYFITYVPKMKTTETPKFAEKLYWALFREYAELRSANAKRDVIGGQIKIRRAVVPFLAYKVRKSELSVLAKLGKTDLSLREVAGL